MLTPFARLARVVGCLFIAGVCGCAPRQALSQPPWSRVSPAAPVFDQRKAQELLTLGESLFKQKAYARAELELKQAAEIGPPFLTGRAKFLLGQIYDATSEEDAALEAYLDAATLWISPNLESVLRAAYRKKHGTVADLEDTLDRMARSRPKVFEPGRFVRAESVSARRVALAEWFIDPHGTSVVSELTYEGLTQRYDRAALAALEYEVNFGATTNPLANPESVERAKYYGVVATPSARLDGANLETRINSTNPADTAEAFTSVTREVEARLAVSSLATVGLQAKRSGQQITITASASLLTEAASNVRKPVLRVVLAQDIVRHTGANGVRFHSFVVRRVLTPPTGVRFEPQGRTVAYNVTVDVPALLNALIDYLQSSADGRSYALIRPTASRVLSLSEGTLPFDADQLLVIAFVQDDDTKQVLQAAFVRPS